MNAKKPGNDVSENPGATASRVIDPSVLTGYAPNVTLFASRYKQGGRTVYSMDLSPEQIISTVPKPDPDVPSPGNRQIRAAHADAFGHYIREREEWVSPSIMLRTPTSFDFEVQTEVAGIQFGLLSIPRRSLGDLHIVDGQHRILGMFRASDAINSDIDKARSAKATARKNEGEGSRAEQDAQAVIDRLQEQRNRLEGERVNVQIFVESDEQAYRQIFYDVADNALGITASVRVRFDTRKVINRALPMVMEEAPLLKGRVEREADRLGNGSQHLMSAKHVAEVIRAVNVGMDGRVSRRQEVEFSDRALADRAISFFDSLTENFPQLNAVQHGQLTTGDLRKNSLLGSVLFVRVLAGVYHDLVVDRGLDRSFVDEFFAKLAPHVIGSVYPGSIWSTHLPDIFQDGAFAPNSRRQDIVGLSRALTGWAIDKPKFLDAKPQPRPKDEDEEISTEEEKRRVDELIAR